MFEADLDTLKVDGKPFASGVIRVDAGDTVGIFGRNGVGKSTVMRSLVGLGAHPLERKIDGQEMLPGDPRVTIVFQSDSLVEWLTAGENLSLAKSGISPATGGDDALESLRQLEIEHLARRWPRRLSGGETKLVELARARQVGHGGILILDEPFTGLDYYYQSKVEKLIERELSDRFSAQIIVSHDLQRIARLTNKTLVFQQRDGILTFNEIIAPVGTGAIDRYVSQIEEAFYMGVAAPA